MLNLATVSVVLMLAASPAPRVALMPLTHGEGVSEKTAEAITDSLASELRRIPSIQLTTHRELGAVLSAERQKSLLGCTSDSCLAEISGALNAERLITGTISKLGESWTVHLQLVDTRKVVTVASVDRRKRGGSVDDVLDALPGMAQELFGAAPTAPTPAAEPKPALSPPWSEDPVDPSIVPARLTLVTDGQGNYLALTPFGGTDAPFFAGKRKALFQQRVFGGGSEAGKQFSLSFWEPRARVPAEAMFSFRDGQYTLSCGAKEIGFRPVGAKEAGAFWKSTKLYKTRWQRRGYALARDDEGNYFYVDQARLPEGNTDFRIYLGSPGGMVAQKANVLARDSDGDIFGVPEGKLRLSHAKKEAEWIQGSSRKKLIFLPVEDNAGMIYTTLGAYAKQLLGTPCDAVLGGG